MPLVLQLHLDTIGKHSKFGIDTFNTFWIITYIKVFAWQRRLRTGQQQWSRDHKSLNFFFETDKVKIIKLISYFKKKFHATSLVYVRPACVTSVLIELIIVVCSSYWNRWLMAPPVINSIKKTRKSSASSSSSCNSNKIFSP